MPAASASLLQKKAVFKYSKCYATFDITKYLDVVCLQKNRGRINESKESILLLYYPYLLKYFEKLCFRRNSGILY